jgi:APA family basic amino acid/polyamine antiporter
VRFQVARGYRRVLVPLDAASDSVDAFSIACRLAADDHASITAVVVLEIPPLLPIDTHLPEVEEVARGLLERAGATGDARGVRVTQTLVRARDAGAAILRQARSDGAELIVIGASGTDRVRHVLHGAGCRVMVVSTSLRS